MEITFSAPRSLVPSSLFAFSLPTLSRRLVGDISVSWRVRFPYFSKVCLSSFDSICQSVLVFPWPVSGLTMTYLPYNPHVAQHDAATHNHDNATLPPVRRLISCIEHYPPEGVQRQGEDIHAVDCDTPDRVVPGALEDDARPAKDQWVNHVRGAGQVKCEESPGKWQSWD